MPLVMLSFQTQNFIILLTPPSSQVNNETDFYRNSRLRLHCGNFFIHLQRFKDIRIGIGLILKLLQSTTQVFCHMVKKLLVNCREVVKLNTANNIYKWVYSLTIYNMPNKHFMYRRNDITE
jgi:hypothetical protein